MTVSAVNIGSLNLSHKSRNSAHVIGKARFFTSAHAVTRHSLKMKRGGPNCHAVWIIVEVTGDDHF